jgi:hypothetical protein
VTSRYFAYLPSPHHSSARVLLLFCLLFLENCMSATSRVVSVRPTPLVDSPEWLVTVTSYVDWISCHFILVRPLVSARVILVAAPCPRLRSGTCLQIVSAFPTNSSWVKHVHVVLLDAAPLTCAGNSTRFPL